VSARSEVVTWAEGVSQQVRDCRDYGHSWQPHDAWWDGEKRAYRRQLRCGSCGTTRRQWITQTGLISSSTYSYTRGYPVPHGVGHLTRDEKAVLRLIGVLQLAEQH
jgi:hypothetical protein